MRITMANTNVTDAANFEWERLKADDASFLPFVAVHSFV